MKFAFASRLGAAVGCALALGAVAAPSAASADVSWHVSGVFDDGSTLVGVFKVNIYDFLQGPYTFTTTDGPSISGFTYTRTNSYHDNDATSIDLQPQWQSDLHLVFTHDLLDSSPNALIGGPTAGNSWECRGSYSCYLAEDGQVRFLTEGSATAFVPEPAAWGLMLLGFGGAGAALRATRRRPGLATA